MQELDSSESLELELSTEEEGSDSLSFDSTSRDASLLSASFMAVWIVLNFDN